MYQPVPQGPRAYRQRLQGLGPFIGLLPPALLGAVGWVLLQSPSSTAKGVGGFALAVFAAPGLLVAGVPLSSGARTYLLAAVGSAVMWFVLGVIASRRATRRPVCSWRDFWREWMWLAVGVWVGVIAALVGTNLVMGRALF